jgi:hypothetical protein
MRRRINRYDRTKWIVLLSLSLALAGCGHGGGGGAAAPNPAEGNTWDQMQWDKGKWG